MNLNIYMLSCCSVRQSIISHQRRSKLSRLCSGGPSGGDADSWDLQETKMLKCRSLTPFLSTGQNLKISSARLSPHTGTWGDINYGRISPGFGMRPWDDLHVYVWIVWSRENLHWFWVIRTGCWDSSHPQGDQKKIPWG